MSMKNKNPSIKMLPQVGIELWTCVIPVWCLSNSLLLFFHVVNPLMSILPILCVREKPEWINGIFTMHGLLLARLESAYSLIWGSHEIWGKGDGDTLALLWLVGLFNKTVIGGNLALGMGDGELTNQYPAWGNLAGNLVGNLVEIL